jgi:hypothetical protein
MAADKTIPPNANSIASPYQTCQAQAQSPESLLIFILERSGLQQQFEGQLMPGQFRTARSFISC